MGNNIVIRSMFPDVCAHLKEKEITVIIGARQVGKTTMLQQLKEHLLQHKKAKEQEIKSFNLDLITDLELFGNQRNFLSYLKSEIEGRKVLYIFVDEVQRLPNPGLFFKGIYDLALPIKLVLTGSSSLEIKAKIQEPLTGRKRMFHLFPFSFKEYLNYYYPSFLKLVRIKELDSYHFRQIMDRLSEYLVYGGYPRVVLERNKTKKSQILNEIYSSYIERDIAGFLKIKSALNFSKLVSILSAQTGQLVNSSEISNTLGIKQETIYGYLQVLEQTFIIQLLKPFFKNIRKELTKMPKIFFWDNGLRNFALEAFQDFEFRVDKGALLENFVFTELGREASSKMRYWRTKDKNEVDFIIEYPSGAIVPIEVKAQKFKKPVLPRNLGNFINKYQPDKAFIVNLGITGKIKIQKTSIFFIYPFQLSKII